MSTSPGQLICGVIALAFAASACGDGSEEADGSGASGPGAGSVEPTGGAAVATGGTTAATGGALSAAGGALAETGGAPAETGGAPAETGGAPAETGGAPAETGGAPAETGGAPAETGGAPAETGGAPAETGGTPPAETGGTPPAETGGTPPAETGGAPPATGGTTAGDGPEIPAIVGDCPLFDVGVNELSVGGLSPILMDVGAVQATPGPLIFYWHGTGSSPTEYRGGFIGGMGSDVIDEIRSLGGVIVAFGDTLGGTATASGTAIFGESDLGVADQIVACAVRDHNIDPRRIYVTGCSAGGLMTGTMATMRSSYVAAAVPNSGGATFPHSLNDPSHVPALMTIHGGASDFVGVSFAQTSATLDSQFDREGGFVVNCDHGGGHCQNRDLYEETWDFMKAHTFGAPSPYASGIPQSYPDYCSIY